MNTEQPTILPWHREAATACFEKTSSPFVKDIVEAIARHDPHAETLRLLERALSHTMSTETGRIIVQDAIHAHLAAMKGTP